MISQKAFDSPLDELLNIIKKYPMGVGIAQISDELTETTFSRRTLIRRLSQLRDSGKIKTKGQKRGVLYFSVELVESLSLSLDGTAIKAQVTQSTFMRKPIGYQPAFLYDYIPNETHYLSKEISKHLHDIGHAPTGAFQAGTYSKDLLHRLLIDLSWNSSRLEGNTYSLLETERLLIYGTTAEGKNAFEAQMILNHKDAIEFMVEEAAHTELGSHIILNIHALLSNNLLHNPKARGQLRRIPVGIAASVYSPPEIPQSIEAHFHHLLSSAKKIQDPFEQAFFMLVQLPYLQPFEDVNKRVSRLSANIPLLKNHLLPLSFTDVPQQDYINGLLGIYELNNIALLRDVFVWAYERSAQRYQVVQNTLVEPNLLHMKFREEIVSLVQYIVIQNIRGKMITQTIIQWAEAHIPVHYQQAFSQLVEQEISSLHHGNLAIYKLKPEVFAQWAIR